MVKPKNLIPIERVELYDKLIATDPKIERKGKTIPYTSINGHMFTFLSNDGTMGLRLSKDDRDEIVQKYNTKLMEQYGRVMKEFIEVPNELLTDTKSLSEYLQKSYNYVSNLKPKSTKK